MLHFENPAAFCLLLLPLLLYILRKTGIFTCLTFPLTLSDWGGRAFVWKSTFSRFSRYISSVLMYTAFTATIVAFASPVATRQEKQFTSQGTEILFVIDTSPSMAARDMHGDNRLEAAKKTISLIVRESPGSLFGLVTMAVDAALVVPSTLDHSVFQERLSSLVIGEMGDGTAIGTGLSTAVYHLASSTAPKKCIVLITDGENNAGSVHPYTAAKLAAENNITIYITGIGTRGTVPVEYTDPITGKIFSGYLESNFDEHELERLASLGGGLYFKAADALGLNTALKEVSDRQVVVQSYRINNITEPLYANFIATAIIFFAVGWIIRRLYLKES